jgi:hypothetical protein
MAYISTNKLAQELKIKREELIDRLQKLNLIDKHQQLTKLGIEIGGKYKTYMGTEYISWNDKDKIIAFLEKKSIWNRLFSSDKTKELDKIETKKRVDITTSNDIRKKYNTLEYRTEDGHYVRSKAELIIDNWLYNKGIVHAYEKKLPTKENLLSDFYIPQKNIYIEYWGYKNQEQYLKRKKIKQQIYKKYKFNLIELNDNDILNLDDILPRHLLEFGLTSYK